MATRKSNPPATPATPAAIPNTAAVGGISILKSIKSVFSPIKTEFLTEPNSPFKDKYSIDKESAFLADYIASGANDHDPLYDRYIELIDRRDRLAKMKSRHQSEMGSDALVEHTESAGMLTLGRLVDDGEDALVVHTLEGYRMFMGRRPEPGTNERALIGGKRAGAVLRSLWNMTGQDNPYADWALVRHEQSMAEIAARLDREIAAAEILIAEQKKRGLRLSILLNKEPAELALGFKSPYGFATASLINRFDYFVRILKTLQRKNLRTDDQVRQSIHEITRLIRRVWNDTSRFDRNLSREEIASLSRADYLPGADEIASKRIEFATQVFGVVPIQIFVCDLQPKHSRRHRQMTPAERALMVSIGQRLEQGESLQMAASDVDGLETAAMVGVPKTEAGLAGGELHGGELETGAGA